MLSKLEGKGGIYSFKKINITEIVEQVIKKMQNIAIERKIQISIERSAAAFIYGDAESLQRLIMNIVNNALNFTPAGGFIRIATDCHGGKVTIRVQDTGIGIAKEDLPHVFERFYRADRARGRNGGTGLGLSIAQEIVHKHNGTINIESEISKGTLVTIVFPAVS
jgi:two-component system phosphate regulon sensor histidine kinase PhoR